MTEEHRQMSRWEKRLYVLSKNTAYMAMMDLALHRIMSVSDADRELLKELYGTVNRLQNLTFEMIEDHKRSTQEKGGKEGV